MTILKVYKETDITNKEMIEVLQKLGFTEVAVDVHDYRMESKSFDMYLIMAQGVSHAVTDPETVLCFWIKRICRL